MRSPNSSRLSSCTAALPPDAIYSFKHALVQDAAYESLLKSRAELHGQIARTLEERFPNIVVTQPEIVAHHFTEAGLVEPAINYWLKAGNLALSRSANAAVGHLKQGLQTDSQYRRPDATQQVGAAASNVARKFPPGD